jgi:alpha-tubulin suppressor-like RCC1 family protein
VLSTGAVRCWGANTYGQLGNGKRTTSRYPVKVSGLDGLHAKATSVTVGNGFACARLTDGSVRCWGRNESGQLATGGTLASATPVVARTSATVTLAGATSITAGASHACAIIGGGATATVRCWGSNTSGQIGDGTHAVRRYAARLGTALAGASNIAAGNQFTIAVVPSRVRTPTAAAAWGRNTSGQLGLGTLTGRTTAATIRTL